MAENFGLKIGVEGEKDFKRALSDINSSFKVLGSEMKLVESQFGKNDTSVSGLTARNEVLNKQIETQKEKIATLKAALENSATSFGENDKRTKAWQTQLNNAEAALNDMERELKENATAADKMKSKSPEKKRKSQKVSLKVCMAPSQKLVLLWAPLPLPLPLSALLQSPQVRRSGTWQVRQPKRETRSTKRAKSSDCQLRAIKSSIMRWSAAVLMSRTSKRAL